MLQALFQYTFQSALRTGIVNRTADACLRSASQCLGVS